MTRLSLLNEKKLKKCLLNAPHWIMDSGAPFSFLNKSFAQSPIHSTLYTPYLALVFCCVCSFGMKASNHLMMVVGPTVKNRVRVYVGEGGWMLL